MKCMYYDKCSDQHCDDCWAFDDGSYEDATEREYNEFLVSRELEYYEMIKEYSDGNVV